ncbi:hypothetical protein ACQV9O_25990 [Ralstonia pseudosolanacearum]|uniref:hypothetical protein n=1 Tax=Ralstonia pseudosolanacearum TaxID=1310165 RepID=UPI003D2A7BB5
MPDPDDLAIAVVPRALDTISAKGDDRLGFAVTRLNNPGGLLGVLVSADIVTPAGAGFPEDASPQLSVDGQQWSSGADKRTDASGLAWFYIRSRSSAGKFQVSGAIGDAKAPFHKVHASLVAKGSVVEVEFAPKTSLTTWQGGPFPQQPQTVVHTKPGRVDAIDLSVSGPGADDDPAANNASFHSGGRKAKVGSEGVLPPVDAGRLAGDVTITAAVGAVRSAPLTWHVLPVADRLVNKSGGKVIHIAVDEFETHLPNLVYQVTGHRIKGEIDSVGIVAVDTWPVRLELTETTFAKFEGASALEGGKVLITTTDKSGQATILGSQLKLQGNAARKTITINAAWNTKHDASGRWIPAPAKDAQLSIYLDT